MINIKFISSWDDGHLLDLKVAELLKKYELPGIFFIPSNCQLVIDEIEKLFEMGFEIGGHTMTHPNDLKQLKGDILNYEIEMNKEWLEDIIGQKIDKFCYPKGRYNQDTIEVLKWVGYKQARTVTVLNKEQPIDKFRIKTTIHVHPNRVEYKGRKWNEVALELWNKVKNDPDGYFHIWGHSWELTRYNLWGELEEFFKKINNEYVRNNKSNRSDNNSNQT